MTTTSISSACPRLRSLGLLLGRARIVRVEGGQKLGLLIEGPLNAQNFASKHHAEIVTELMAIRWTENVLRDAKVPA